MSDPLGERDAEFGDLAIVVNIEKDVHFSPWTIQNFQDALAAKNIFKVFFLDDMIVGYYIALLASDECQILNIAIKKCQQNKGLGHYLINHLKDLSKSLYVASIFLEVRVSNIKAIKLYEKNGFNELGVRNNYYKTLNGTENGILMGLEL